MIAPLLYAAPSSFYSLWLRANRVEFEVCEHYERRTLRNKCIVGDSNGALPLSIPIIKSKGKTPYCDVLIDYREAWQKQHWHALHAAYGSTPYFELLDFLFAPLYESRFERLIDFNLAMHKAICRVLDIDQQVECLDSYRGISPEFSAYAEKKANFSAGPRYYQVFEEQRGFIEGTSILDLLFHHGPEARLLL